jgi:hypothetical protein
MVARPYVVGPFLPGPFCILDEIRNNIFSLFGFGLYKIQKCVIFDGANHFVGKGQALQNQLSVKRSHFV